MSKENPNFTIITTGGCNAKCDFCTDPMNVKASPYYISNLMQSISKLPNIFQEVSISGGEPTISDDLDAILQIIKFSGKFRKVVLSTNGTKLLRLSTRSPGELTMSSIIGIDSSKRFNITADGIILGNFKFQGVADLMTHMNSQCCCVCLDNIDNLESIALKCGHILHQSCYESNVLYSNQCPLCKIVAKESFLIPKGASCVYTMSM